MTTDYDMLHHKFKKIIEFINWDHWSYLHTGTTANKYLLYLLTTDFRSIRKYDKLTVFILIGMMIVRIDRQ